MTVFMTQIRSEWVRQRYLNTSRVFRILHTAIKERYPVSKKTYKSRF